MPPRHCRPGPFPFQQQLVSLSQGKRTPPPPLASAPPAPGGKPATVLTLALQVVVTRLGVAEHLDRHMPVHTADVGHLPRLQQDDAVVTLAPGHCAVLQGPGLVHLGGTKHGAHRSGTPGPSSRHLLWPQGTSWPAPGADLALDRAGLPPGRATPGGLAEGWGCPTHTQRERQWGGDSRSTPVGEGPQDCSQERVRVGAQGMRSLGVKRWGRHPRNGQCHSAGCRLRRSGSRLCQSCCRQHPL